MFKKFTVEDSVSSQSKIKSSAARAIRAAIVEQRGARVLKRGGRSVGVAAPPHDVRVAARRRHAPIASARRGGRTELRVGSSARRGGRAALRVGSSARRCDRAALRAPVRPAPAAAAPRFAPVRPRAAAAALVRAARRIASAAGTR